MSCRYFVLAAIAACGLAGQTPAAVIYSNDFETNSNGFSNFSGTSFNTSNNLVSLPSVSSGDSTHFGRFGTGSTTLSLSGLVAGSVYTVAFDLFLGGSWDGNNTTFGPDSIKLTADSTSLIDATFSNLTETGFEQSYSDSNPVDSDTTNRATNPAGTGADSSDLTPNDIYSRYANYSFSKGASNPVLTFTATSSTASLVFAGVNLQGLQISNEPDEFWAIDNVVVTGEQAPQSGVVPVPGNLVMLGSVAIFGLVGRAARRIRKS